MIKKYSLLCVLFFLFYSITSAAEDKIPVEIDGATYYLTQDELSNSCIYIGDELPDDAPYLLLPTNDPKCQSDEPVFDYNEPISNIENEIPLNSGSEEPEEFVPTQIKTGPEYILVLLGAFILGGIFIYRRKAL